jgi:hypothetical protein
LACAEVDPNDRALLLTLYQVAKTSDMLVPVVTIYVENFGYIKMLTVHVVIKTV